MKSNGLKNFGTSDFLPDKTSEMNFLNSDFVIKLLKIVWRDTCPTSPTFENVIGITLEWTFLYAALTFFKECFICHMKCRSKNWVCSFHTSSQAWNEHVLRFLSPHWNHTDCWIYTGFFTADKNSTPTKLYFEDYVTLCLHTITHLVFS